MSCITDIRKHFLSASVLVVHNGLPSGLEAWKRQLMTPDQLQGLLTGCQLLPVQHSVFTVHNSLYSKNNG